MVLLHLSRATGCYQHQEIAEDVCFQSFVSPHGSSHDQVPHTFITIYMYAYELYTSLNKDSITGHFRVDKQLLLTCVAEILMLAAGG